MEVQFFVSLVFFASSLLDICESAKSEDVFVTKGMLQQFQKEMFDRLDQIDIEVREIKGGILSDDTGIHLLSYLCKV